LESWSTRRWWRPPANPSLLWEEPPGRELEFGYTLRWALAFGMMDRCSKEVGGRVAMARIHLFTGKVEILYTDNVSTPSVQVVRKAAVWAPVCQAVAR
jgi:hypothetical protein